jgi:hypothetical protein
MAEVAGAFFVMCHSERSEIAASRLSCDGKSLFLRTRQHSSESFRFAQGDEEFLYFL